MRLSDQLSRFDRKERNWLVRDALGERSRTLSSDFLERIQLSVRQNYDEFQIDNSAWWSIDYHIDWLVAVLQMFKTDKFDNFTELKNINSHSGKKRGLITGNQQDIDLVVASDNSLILIEAKGIGSWKSQGFKDKIERLQHLTNCLVDDDGRCGGISLYFILCSPSDHELESLSVSSWPTWMVAGSGKILNSRPSPLWMKLKAAPNFESFLTVSRCNEQGKSSARGDHWRVADKKYKIFDQ